jgi:hypothetical protein
VLDAVLLSTVARLLSAVAAMLLSAVAAGPLSRIVVLSGGGIESLVAAWSAVESDSNGVERPRFCWNLYLRAGITSTRALRQSPSIPTLSIISNTTSTCVVRSAALGAQRQVVCASYHD